MTDGILVWIQERRGGTPLLSLKHPLDHEKAEEACDLTQISAELLSLMKTGQLEPDVVKQVGSSLHDCLMKHEAIEFELQQLKQQKGGPIYLRLDPTLADDLPWEALHAEKFLAIDKGWPIARVKNVRRSVKAVETFVPPLRIFALLAPTGPNVPAGDEWDSLYDAVKSSDLNVKLRVLVCDDDLKTRIDQAATKDSWIECAFVPPRQGELFDTMASFAPHIVHFFCHGKASSPPFLQAGNRIDFKTNQAGSLTLEASQLRQRADPNENVWLVTLDCCETAAQATEAGSKSRAFASSLVMEGVPAVIGMREPLDQAVAARFCKLFYSQLLEELRQKLNAARSSGSPMEIKWASPLFAARQELCALADPHRPINVVAMTTKDWTIPVLYIRPEPFMLKVAADAKGEFMIERPAPANAPQPAPVQPASESTGNDLSKKLQVASEIQQLSIQRAQLAGATALPDSVRTAILGEIDARIGQLQKELGA